MKPRHPEGEIEPFKGSRAASDNELIEGEIIDGEPVGARGIKDKPDLPERLNISDAQLERMQRLNQERDRIRDSMTVHTAEQIMNDAAASPDHAALSGNDSEILVDLIPEMINSHSKSAADFVKSIEQWANDHRGDARGVLETLSLAHQRYTTFLGQCRKFNQNANPVEQQAAAGEIIRAWDKLRKMSEDHKPTQQST